MFQSKHDLKSVLNKSFIERQEVYTKLYGVNDDVIRNTSFWRNARFGKLCSESIDLDSHSECDLERYTTLSSFEKARKGFRKFRKIDLCSEDEISIATFSQFVALKTSVVDSLKPTSHKRFDSEFRRFANFESFRLDREPS